MKAALARKFVSKIVQSQWHQYLYDSFHNSHESNINDFYALNGRVTRHCTAYVSGIVEHQLADIKDGYALEVMHVLLDINDSHIAYTRLLMYCDSRQTRHCTELRNHGRVRNWKI